MPVYDYWCPRCDEERIDVIIAVRDLDVHKETCPECGHEMLRKVGNAGGFRLRGDGWGEDGYDKYIGDINKTRRANGKAEIGYDDIHGTNIMENK